MPATRWGGTMCSEQIGGLEGTEMFAGVASVCRHSPDLGAPRREGKHGWRLAYALNSPIKMTGSAHVSLF